MTVPLFLVGFALLVTNVVLAVLGITDYARHGSVATLVGGVFNACVALCVALVLARHT